MTAPIRFLVCAPHHYEVDYVINPWMEGNIHKSSKDTAVEQWQALYQIISEKAAVDLVKPPIRLARYGIHSQCRVGFG